jgi:hypothetical protein
MSSSCPILSISFRGLSTILHRARVIYTFSSSKKRRELAKLQILLQIHTLAQHDSPRHPKLLEIKIASAHDIMLTVQAALRGRAVWFQSVSVVKGKV